MGLLCLSSVSPSKEILHSFEEKMTPKNVIIQFSKKEIIRPIFEGSAKASIASENRNTRVMTMSMAKAAASITLKQVVTSTLQSHKT